MSPAGDATGGPAASARRVKRRVIAPVHDFFAAAAPGLEQLCRRELLSPPISLSEATVETGGVSFRGRLVDLYRANLHLRTANRILMRIASFKAENFTRLCRCLDAIDWPLFLPAARAVQVQVSARRCRLYHSEAVAERVGDRIAKAFGSASADPDQDHEEPARVLVRCENDRFTVSLDSSGALLHRRGIKTQEAAAPLRETLAAAVLMWAGYRPGEPLIDPMCGSGTFSIEAAMRIRRIPPGWFRRFAFEAWPAFRRRQWAFLRKEAQKGFVEPATPTVFAGDRDPRTLGPVKQRLAAAGLAGASALFCADFFDLRPEGIEGPGLVVLNPPYGRRLKAEAAAGADAGGIFRHLKRFFCGWKIAVVLPAAQIGPVAFPHEKRRIVHGGLKLFLVTGKIPPPADVKID